MEADDWSLCFGESWLDELDHRVLLSRRLAFATDRADVELEACGLVRRLGSHFFNEAIIARSRIVVPFM